MTTTSSDVPERAEETCPRCGAAPDQGDDDLCNVRMLRGHIRDLERRLADVTAANESIARLVRQIDVILCGEDGAAKQASLCDLVEPIRKLKDERDRLLDPVKFGDRDSQAAAWSAVWQVLEEFGMLSVFSSTNSGRGRAIEFVRSLKEDRDTAIQRAEAAESRLQVLQRFYDRSKQNDMIVSMPERSYANGVALQAATAELEALEAGREVGGGGD